MHAPKKRHHKRRRSTAVVSAKRRSVRRSNPISLGGALKHPMAIIGPALTGAVGAIAVNTVLGKLPLPAFLMTGRTRYLTQGVAAVALGALASRLGVKASLAGKMAEGALTVTLHDAVKDLAGSVGVNLGGMGYYLPGKGVSYAPPSGSAAAPQLSGVSKYMTGPGSGNVTAMRSRAGVGRVGNSFGF